MLEEKFTEVYQKFKLHFYREIFSRFQSREASLTTVETFCMEAIQSMKYPTINEFASFLRISPPNAAYKINSLVKKGYLTRVRSTDDKREFHLQVTQKYMDYYNVSNRYLTKITDRMSDRFSPEQCQQLEHILTVISTELMPELDIPPLKHSENG